MQSHIKCLIHEMVEEGWSCGERTGDSARELRQRVEQAAEDGDLWAVGVCESVVHDGFRRLWTTHAKGGRQKFINAVTGEALSVRERYGIAQRKDDGTPDGSYQIEMIASMPWESVNDLLDRQLKLNAQITALIMLLRFCLGLHKVHPDALSPRAAAEAAGLDWSQLVIEATV